ncbi:hypothetical protein [Xanthobacter sediminis]|uniref:hypothetical protein n=1 Tax=Xanthobacter sediminis TaxID=3119926 RepID=UPI003726F903
MGLDPPERVPNMPRHHLAHQASAVSCLDRNLDAAPIVFDRLPCPFAGARRDEPLGFGLAGEGHTIDPWRIVIMGWAPRLLGAARVSGPGSRPCSTRPRERAADRQPHICPLAVKARPLLPSGELP